MRIKVFYSYARADAEWLERLSSHLKVFEQQGYITKWDHSTIQPGTDWSRVIDSQRSTSDLILLLLSDHYLASEYCSLVEMPQAIELHERGTARIIPILLSPVSWKQTPLGKLHVLPGNGIPLTEWSNREEALTSLAQEIGQIVREIAMAKENEAFKRVRIGRNVCEARIKLGWTQEQLGAPEFSSSYISALERGKISASLKALSIIARRLQVPQERLLEDSPEE